MEKAPARPALRYHGAKWRLASWIISYLPPHDIYVEPYAGSAAILLRKYRSTIEVYNDLDKRVVNFFQVLRDRPEELIRALELTPFSLAEFETSRYGRSDDPLEDARLFYIRAYQSIGGPTAQWRSGWRRQKVISRISGRIAMKPAAKTWADTDHLWTVAERFKGVAIECMDALDLMKIYDEPDSAGSTLYYVDPPYVTATRGTWGKTAYNHELTDDDHRALAAALHELKGLVVLSGYNCDLYEELFSEWERHTRSARVNSMESKEESLWLNPAASSAREAAAAAAVEAVEAEEALEAAAFPLLAFAEEKNRE